MAFNRNGLFFAIEEEEVVALPDAESQEVVPAEVLEEVSGAQQENGEIGELATAIEEAVDGAETLDAVAAPLEESLDLQENGEPGPEAEGVGPDAAAIAEVVTESICDRLGIRRKTQLIPATESFGSRSSRIVATKLAVEAIDEQSKGIWAKVKEAFLKMFAKIKDFLVKLFDSNERILAAAKAANGKLGELKDKKAEKQEFENDSIAKAFATANASDPASIKTATEVLGNHIALTEKLTAIADGVGKTMEDLGKIAEAKEGETKEDIGAVFSRATFAKELEGLIGKSKQMVNGTFYFLTSYEAEASDMKGFVRFDEQSIYKANSVEHKAVKTLTVEEMSDLIDEVVKLAEANAKLKANNGGLVNAEKQITKLIDRAGKAAQKDSTVAEDKKQASGQEMFIRRAASDLGQLAGKLASKIPTANVVACKQALAYVSASMKQYKAEEAAK